MSTNGNLLPEEFQVFFAVIMTFLRRGQFRGQKFLGLVDRIREHDVGLRVRWLVAAHCILHRGRTPSHRYTSSVAGIEAFAYNVSLSSNVVSIGSDSSCVVWLGPRSVEMPVYS